MGKRILVVGSGAREHALVWKLSQSKQVDKIYCAPGNAGIQELAECIPVKADDVVGLAKLATEKGIDLTVVGPEIPLMAGIVDYFDNMGLRAFGPRKNAALLEGSKVFTKNLFKKYGIPTADFGVFDSAAQAREFIKEKGVPIVVKADGLAAGKGVIVAADIAEAEAAVDLIMQERAFGDAGNHLVVEECLQGEEVSVFALCDGKTVVPMVAAQDHKRIFDGDQGPNTGGMGAYSPPPLYTPELHAQVMKDIIVPVVKAMESEGCPYQGILYAGLMVTPEGPKVLEFNARLGDPEAQVVLPLLEGDILPIMEAVVDGCLDQVSVSFKSEACVCVVLASEGYPGDYPKGRLITGLEGLSDGTLIFHAGTKLDGSRILTDGGRVLSIVATGDTVARAIDKVYHEVPRIHFDGMQYRKDIGAKALR
ncbi:MAG: phosphoribosylamine--glycine ligase [Chitinophagales bacterium]